MWKSGITFRQRSVGGQAERRRDVPGARGQLPVCERHELRPRRRPGGVEQERDRVRSRPGVERRRRRHAVDREHARRGRVVGRQLEDADAERPGDLAGRGVERRGDHQRVGADVLEVEGELLCAVRGIERRHGGGPGKGQERAGGLGPVLDDERDPGLLAEPGLAQSAGDSARQLCEPAVRERPSARREDGVRPGLERPRTLEDIPDPIH